MNRLERGIKRPSGASPPHIRNDTTAVDLPVPGLNYTAFGGGESAAMKLSAVDRCIELISDSLGKMPIYVMDRNTRKRIPDHPLNEMLTVRPNSLQTPFAAKKMMEANRLNGNGYALIVRDERSLSPKELIPVPRELVSPQLDGAGRLWYSVIHPFTGEALPPVHSMDMLHTMAYSHNGYTGISVLERASEVISAGRAAQQYNLNYYANGGQPGGVLQTDTDLSGDTTVTVDGQTRTVSKKDLMRAEWEKRHAGPSNAQRIAVLDLGLKYTPIAVSNRDAQFVEQSELSVQDIARFFGVPLYKLQSGKQSYNSNEQNAIEYVVGTLHPIVAQWEEELTYKLLTPAEIRKGLRIRVNLMAELRGDNASRANWYRVMRETGAFSVNDILALEDMPDVEGGDEHQASLNFVPLSDWKELSKARAGTGGVKAGDQ